MRFSVELPAGGRPTLDVDRVTFEGGGLQFWRVVENQQSLTSELVEAWAPAAWVSVKPADASEVGCPS